LAPFHEIDVVLARFCATEADALLTGPGGLAARCTFGRSGVLRGKREGDSGSPAGVWPLRRALFRPDRESSPSTQLALAPIAPDDGWCDDPADTAYNRPVKLPYPASAERMWREDRLYDLVIVLGHNDDPVIAGAGSAVFLHLARSDWGHTEGCIGVDRSDLLVLLAAAKPGDALEIRPYR